MVSCGKGGRESITLMLALFRVGFRQGNWGFSHETLAARPPYPVCTGCLSYLLSPRDPWKWCGPALSRAKDERMDDHVPPWSPRPSNSRLRFFTLRSMGLSLVAR